MYKKSWTIPILVLLLCSCLLINYQESNLSSTYAINLPAAAMPVHYTVSDIISIQVAWPDQTITAHRTKSDWSLSEPVTMRGDVSFIYDMIRRFLSPGNLVVVEEDVTDLERFGITDKSLTVTLEDRTHTIYEFVQGNMTPSGEYYVYIPASNSLHTVPAETFNTISYNPLAWYDKDYIQFDPTTTTQITFYDGVTHHTLTPFTTDEGLRFASPTLSEREVSTCLNFLSTSRALSYIVDDASPQVIANYGLADMPLHITLDDAKGRHTFYISDFATDSNVYYVLIESTGTLIAIPPFIKF